MIKISEDNKEKCCGCSSCKNICPVNAIEMKPDNEGFLYPFINEDKCIKCNLCETVCPMINKKENHEKIDIAFAIRAKNDEILKTSTSGGFFTPLAEEILKNDGVVIGVGYKNNFEIEHIIVTAKNKNDIKQMRGSKYVQSNLGDIFSKTKELLDAHKKVLFSGTPCQINGLINFLKKDYINLITVDLICHGVPSPKLWNEYIKYQQKKHNSKIKEISFRNKTYGYHSGTMKITFNNGEKYYGSARVDYMLKSFFSEISSRPTCYKCNFKDLNHISDFTIFDCWHIKELTDKKISDDDRGFTNLFINTNKGQEVFEKIKSNYEIYKIDKNRAIEIDGVMALNSAKPNKNRKEFYEYLNSHTLEETVNKYIPITYKDYFVEKLKDIFYKLKILKFLKKFK